MSVPISQMKFRPSALFPFVLSCISFALILVLVLSGTQPNSNTDSFLLSFNTTNVGQNLILFNPITPVASAVPTTSVAARSIIADAVPAIPNAPSQNTTLTLAATSNTNTTSAATTSTTTAPTLDVPATTTPANPAAIPIALIATFFQLLLNTFATGMGQVLQTIVSGLVVTQKTSFGVDQSYTIHISGVCSGTVFNPNATANLTSPLNITRCTSYSDISRFIINSTSNIPSSAFVGNANITLPALSKVPSIGRSSASIFSLITTLVLALFILTLIANAISILLSLLLLVRPSIPSIPLIGVLITTLPTTLLQSATFTATTLAITISSSINSFTDVLGASASTGGKFLTLLWIAYLCMQVANGYWMNVWFVKYRTNAFKRRIRKKEQMVAGYRKVGGEVWADLRVPIGDEVDVEGLIRERMGEVGIVHWDEDTKRG